MTLLCTNKFQMFEKVSNPSTVRIMQTVGEFVTGVFGQPMALTPYAGSSSSSPSSTSLRKRVLS